MVITVPIAARYPNSAGMTNRSCHWRDRKSAGSGSEASSMKVGTSEPRPTWTSATGCPWLVKRRRGQRSQLVEQPGVAREAGELRHPVGDQEDGVDDQRDDHRQVRPLQGGPRIPMATLPLDRRTGVLDVGQVLGVEAQCAAHQPVMNSMCRWGSSRRRASTSEPLRLGRPGWACSGLASGLSRVIRSRSPSRSNSTAQVRVVVVDLVPGARHEADRRPAASLTTQQFIHSP